MASLNILCSNRLNLKNKSAKKEHKKILKNISWPINICLKYFMTPTKTFCLPLPCPPPPGTYLMYGPL